MPFCFTTFTASSYSQVVQVEASYPFFPGFTFTAAYRWTDAKTNYNGELMEKPFTSKYKGLLTASYQTPSGLWQFDVTLQLNSGRMPAPYELTDGQLVVGKALWRLRAVECPGDALFPSLVYIRRWREPDKLQAEEPHHRRFQPLGKQL